MSEKKFHMLSRERWRFIRLDEEKVQSYSHQLGVSPLLAKMLLSRKIGNGSLDTVKTFMDPPFELLMAHEGISHPDQIAKAYGRLKMAYKNKESVMINGDPDADGIAGTTILVSALRHLGMDVHFAFPVRSREGHGIQPRIVDEAVEKGVSLLISTDCGSKDLESVEYANTQGLDVIICDHHVLGRRLPNAYAMINPFLAPDPGFFKTLAGAGVTLKFVFGFFDFVGKKFSPELRDFWVAVAALGTLSDRMSLKNPMNRILVQYGSQALNDTRMEGLKALKLVSVGDANVSLKARDLSRTLVPRLNAPGRIGDPAEGIPDSTVVVDLLLLGTGRRHRKLAERLAEKFAFTLEKERKMKLNPNLLEEAASVDDVNERRKYITSRIEDEIDELVDAQVDVEQDKAIIILGQNWNPGVIGIDTDRLKDRFLRPAIILTEYEGSDYIRGSVRSIPSINMYQVIDKVGDRYFEERGESLYVMEVKTDQGTRRINAFGGHSQACGFSIHRSNIELFKESVFDEMDKIPDTQFKYSYDILDTLEIEDITPQLVKQLDRLVPYGQEFDFPVFYLRGVNITKCRSFGNKYQTARTPHMDFVVKSAQGSAGAAVKLPAVGFGLWEKYCELKVQVTSGIYDIIFFVEYNRRMVRGKLTNPELRLNVLDIRSLYKGPDSGSKSPKKKRFQRNRKPRSSQPKTND